MENTHNNEETQSDTQEIENEKDKAKNDKKQKHNAHSQERLNLFKQIAYRNSTQSGLDENNLFFGLMAKIVKKLPPYEQVQLRLQLWSLVDNAELRQISNNSPEGRALSPRPNTKDVIIVPASTTKTIRLDNNIAINDTNSHTNVLQQHSNNIVATEVKCCICQITTSDSLKCSKCQQVIHGACGMSEVREGSSSSNVKCNLCWQEDPIKKERTSSHENLKRAAATMCTTSNKKFKEIDVSATILVHVPKYDRAPLDNKTITGRVIDQKNVADCQTRWRNIRNGFVRSLKPTPSGSSTKQKKLYYLHEELQFVLPFVKAIVHTDEPGNIPVPPEVNTENIESNSTTDEVPCTQATTNTLETPSSGFVDSNTFKKPKIRKVTNKADKAFVDWIKKKN
ncbi:unnamed protein product [Colias eurytheme]|nr:unnamed protein product [Colias eurytheme]